MWVWREESVRGGWRLDSYGQWTYDEPARLERVGAPRQPADSERLAHERLAHERYEQERYERARRARAEGARPALTALPALSELEATPIFRSIAHEVRTSADERGRGRHDDRYDRLEERRRPAEPSIPEPHPGSGPFPAQGRSRRGLAPVETAPPPPPRYEDEIRHDDDRHHAASAEDEMRRRAERRRRPRVEPDSGRHVLRR
ncbi:hypothetical protein LQ327_06690 [Actinomycetospora endophytica]|uniref:Uncharacterized protein n=1 Tax=Actinomycetospora endophytica TaxID=2291215 RepID=A0ABS8P496_9PSEU|nr:hypothetical protein [Actinomycetospora endophytica]MCD2193075.1 hypothetical protein [Actinomycetospora endophytica]